MDYRKAKELMMKTSHDNCNVRPSHSPTRCRSHQTTTPLLSVNKVGKTSSNWVFGVLRHTRQSLFSRWEVSRLSRDQLAWEFRRRDTDFRFPEPGRDFPPSTTKAFRLPPLGKKSSQNDWHSESPVNREWIPGKCIVAPPLREFSHFPIF